MAVRPIVRFPDARLRRPCRPVDEFGPAIQALATDLLDTLRAAPGIGITAAHVGELQRLVVLQLTPDATVLAYANPEIVWSSPETARYREGSISMPGISEEVDRPARVTVRYRDLDGAAQEVTADGLLAVCLQHEIDQLDGVFWLQRLSRLKRDAAVRRYEKALRAARL